MGGLQMGSGAASLFGKDKDWKTRLAGGLDIVSGAAKFVPFLGTSVGTAVDVASTGLHVAGAVSEAQQGIQSGRTLTENRGRDRFRRGAGRVSRV